jgi:hypothetical protein
MQKGHMKGQRKSVRSTKVRKPNGVEIKIEPGTEHSPLPTTPIKQHDDIFVHVTNLTDTIHTNQMGAFPLTSQQGYRYIMVRIHLDCNYIFCELMKNRTEDKRIIAYQKMVGRMEVSGLRLKHHRLDDKCSEKFKQCIKKNWMTHKLVPPDCHQRNIANRAIQTFKNHFVSILSGVDDRFPLSVWCHFLCPVKFMVNLLRQSNVTPKVSAYAHIHGIHDYMKRPFSPLGCAVQAHVKPKNRQSWDVHLDAGFNIGTAMEHHRCFTIYIIKTRATRASDTVFFKHQYITNPQVSPETLIIMTATALTNAIKGMVTRDTRTADALTKVSNLFAKIAAAKAATARATEQQTHHHTHPDAHCPVPLPRLHPIATAKPTTQLPRVPNTTQTPNTAQAWPVDDCHVVGAGAEDAPPLVVEALPSQLLDHPECRLS